MIYQDSYGTVREIKDEGCYFADYLNAYTFQTGRQLNTLDVNELYYEANDKKGWNGKPVMERNCFINDAVTLCRGVLNWDIVEVRKEGKDYQADDDEIEIWLMRRFSPGAKGADAEGFVYHFVLKSKYGTIYDPIHIGSVTATIGELHTKRIIKLRERSKV